jgi:alkylation response protein AidB-like acyl-CoA dehydrogenase
VQDAYGAGWIVVTAQLGGRLAQFLVDRRTAGIGVRRQRTLDITRRLDEVVLDNVAVPPSALLHAGELQKRLSRTKIVVAQYSSARTTSASVRPSWR